jgi:GH25 family lysozyme M1 (1,4-beta-N-acetylmuramidase)
LDLQDPPAECLDLLRIFLMELESFSGKRPLVRTDYAGWTRILQAGGTRVPGLDQFAWVRDYPLWVVDDTARSPRVPVPWEALRWAFWQFSTRGRGGKYGVQSQYINLNLYNGVESVLKGGACWQEK